MKIVGIVAEYNPFHRGHAYQLQKVRENFGDDTAIVCVMSGDFVQRGEPAVFSKFARAEAAVRCGADLVIELPLHISIGSAERFADGAVQILGRLGVVEYLVFGSESNDIDLLKQTARVLDSAAFDDRIRLHLERGCSYPAARSAALQELMGGIDATVTPNDNLGIEYVRAINRHGYHIEPCTVRRMGAMHDQNYDGEMKSGSELRGLLKSNGSITDYVPEKAYEVYNKEMEQGRGPVFLKDLELAILSRLRVLSMEKFSELPDAAEGLENKLSKACRREHSLEKIYDSVKSKRYTHARIRRMTMCAALGIAAKDYKDDLLYARVLALNGRGGKVLRLSEQQRTIEVISKPASARQLHADPLSMFCRTADAHDLFVLGYSNVDERGGEQDWQTSPIFVK